MPKTKFVRVAVEGATTDGRTIDRNSLIEMAASYNPSTYTALVNMEHIRGISAEPPFNSYGHITGLRTEEIDLTIGDKTEKRLALFAEIDALDSLVEINRKGQKLFTSIEINPNFAGTGKAYLMGLAVTNSPASLGTEMLKFCAGQGENSPLAARKQAKHHEIAEAIETSLEFSEAGTGADAAPNGFLASLQKFMDKVSGTAPAQAPTAPAAVTQPAADPATGQPAATESGQFKELVGLVGGIGTALNTFMSAQAEENRRLREEMSALQIKAETTPAASFTQRPLANGGKAPITDC
jgi:hypothetical protein